MAVIQPWNAKYPGYLLNQSGASNFNGQWFDTRKNKGLWVQLSYTAAASVGSTFGVHGTEDDSFATFFVLNPTSAVIDSGAFPTVTNGFVPVPAAATAGSTALFFDTVPSYCRLAYLVGTSSSKVFTAFMAGKAT